MSETTQRTLLTIPAGLHRQLKAQAALAGISLQEFAAKIIEAGLRALSKEEAQ